MGYPYGNPSRVYGTKHDFGIATFLGRSFYGEAATLTLSKDIEEQRWRISEWSF